ncbi:MAG: NUDIX hydrolase [Cellulomonas sp.]
MTAPTSGAAALELASWLDDWRPVSAGQDRLRTEYSAFLRAGPRTALDRDGGPQHVTASCFVFTADLDRVLLCLHKKGQFWVQLGGHIEAHDASVADAALREAREEGGIVGLRPCGTTPLDVNRHDLSAAFGRCRTHWDVGYAAVADAAASPVTSAESDDVAWWPIDALPAGVPDGFGERLTTVLAELRFRSTT